MLFFVKAKNKDKNYIHCTAKKIKIKIKMLGLSIPNFYIKIYQINNHENLINQGSKLFKKHFEKMSYV